MANRILSVLVRSCALATLAAIAFAGCAEQARESAVAPRPVKLETVGGGALGANESFVGTLRAKTRADLSFESPGRIASVLVDVGDRVRAGQVLARLEEGPAQWNRDKAEADRLAAVAALAERNRQLEQSEALARDQIISPTALESVRTQQQIAATQLQAAEAAFALAARSLSVARIVAPFDGEIVGRLVQPHADIGAGQPIFQIEAGRHMEVVAMLPEGVATRIAPGLAATATISAQAGGVSALPVTLERLSARSDSGSLVQAIFAVRSPAAGLRSGSVVAIELPRSERGSISIPASALLSDATAGSGAVYLLDPTRNVIVRRAVKVGDAPQANGRVLVLAGLQPGDQVAIAGVAFLTEGQAAVKYVPETLVGKERP